jgi:hypothetical protein
LILSPLRERKLSTAGVGHAAIIFTAALKSTVAFDPSGIFPVGLIPNFGPLPPFHPTLHKSAMPPH